MPDDHLAFLINKFIDDIQEAEKKGKNFPLENELQSIKILLEKKNMLNSSPHVKKLRPRLAELNDLLAECVAMAEKRRKKSFKEIWHRVKINRKLKEIKKTLEECKEIFEKEECEVFSSSILVLKPQAFHYFDQSKIYGFENQVRFIFLEQMIINVSKLFSVLYKYRSIYNIFRFFLSFNYFYKCFNICTINT